MTALVAAADPDVVGHRNQSQGLAGEAVFAEQLELERPVEALHVALSEHDATCPIDGRTPSPSPRRLDSKWKTTRATSPPPTAADHLQGGNSDRSVTLIRDEPCDPTRRQVLRERHYLSSVVGISVGSRRLARPAISRIPALS